MKRSEWVAVALVVGGGIVLQIPNYGTMNMNMDMDMDGESSPVEATDQDRNLTRVALDVTGMT